MTASLHNLPIWIWLFPIWIVQLWFAAALWVWQSIAAVRGLPKVPNLLDPQYDNAPIQGPSLTVIVPALNEETKVRACLQSLLQQQYAALRILAVDDRSTDRTGSIMDELAAAHSGRIDVLHVTELPAGWLGKTHAMALAARRAIEQGSEYLLFTDADILFTPDALRRSMACALATKADHFVTIPTLILHRWDEAALLSFFQVCGLWTTRLWRVADPGSKRDAFGVGAFNLLRSEAYLQVGGFEALRMEIIEDLGLARRIKRAGLAQRVAFGRDLVSVHWAAGALGVVEGITKNIFSAFKFRILFLLGACAWFAGFSLLPGVSLFVGLYLWPLLLPALIIFAALTLEYRALGRFSGISAWNALLSPFAALLLIYALLRSMTKTLRQGGVVWRGTFYPLAELRKHVSPLW
jgi:glycosyltransferase involved in cell wall biosynthesis